MLTPRWRTEEVDRHAIGRDGSGMPRVSRSIERSVFFLFRIDPKTGETTGPHGTGCVVARESEALPGEVHLYGVTNQHVVHKIGASIIRLNTLDGGIRPIELEPTDWRSLYKGDDLVAVDLSEEIEVKRDAVSHIDEKMFLAPEDISRLDVRAGEDTFMCGLFVSHPGGERNVPSFRFGNVSMMASEAAPVEIESTGAYRPAHLVDTRSRTGFSGSPVFLYRVPFNDLERLSDKPLPVHVWGPSFYSDAWTTPFVGLLGIHCAQFWDEITARKPSSKAQRRGNRY